ncbi:DUF6153 family protein [Streptomyces sp. NPDC001388]|uniref:DUF6153 family protein n=1 Tax=unclassified Streptomyces TaxID=2593676 RepID=UPI0036C6C155
MRAVNGLWRRAVCVLGLLVGLLGMHGLAPGGLLPHAHAAQGGSHADVRPVAAVAPAEVHGDCSGDGGRCGGGHVHHADATCASAGVGGGPALPEPAAGSVLVPVPHDTLRPFPAAAPDGARAPPSLAELQLLRI